jgi:hypothetical protein
MVPSAGVQRRLQRQDVYVGGNMFVYFSLDQVRHEDFREPDFFVVLGVPRRERKSRVVWQEGKGPVEANRRVYCRLLAGMQHLPQGDLRDAFTILKTAKGIDNQSARRLKQKLVAHFREQLMLGIPTNADEAGLRRLAAQIKAQKVVVKLFLRHLRQAAIDILNRSSARWDSPTQRERVHYDAEYATCPPLPARV